MKIAMWSGPRNLSTAMMYAFGNRPDCEARDEPFYAAYLAQSGVTHPMQEAILASQPHDPDRVASQITAPMEAEHLYLKVMVHHMLPGFSLDWAQDFVNIHLIRHPARVIASYTAKRDVGELTLDDIGFAQTLRLYKALPGPVIDSADIRAAPDAALQGLCSAIGMPFRPEMLHWPMGPKPFDGAWASHWYDAVHHSTGFAMAEGPLPDIAPQHQALLDAALPIYHALHAERL